MRGSTILAISVLAAVLAGCNAGAQESERRNVRRDFQVGDFRSIGLTGSTDVVVTVGGAPSVRAEGDERLIERLDIRVENGSLKIGMREGSNWSFGFSRDRHATVHVTVPALEAAALTGSGDIRIDRVETRRFVAALSGSGDIEVGRISAEEAAFTLAGSGAIRASGAAQRSLVDLAGSGDVELGGLEAREAIVTLAGSGDVTARATQTARVSLMGSGDVTVLGPARCQVEKRGPGEVRCGQG